MKILMTTPDPGLDSTYGVDYTRVANSYLLDQTQFKDDSDATAAVIDRAYESDRDLLDAVENKIDTTTVSKYDYGLDDLGRRTSVVYTGSAFDTDHLFKYQYNDRSGLTDADRYEGTNPSSPGDQFATFGDWLFDYDYIGNRTEFNLDDEANSTAYSANDLNQYDSTQYPAESYTYDNDGNMTEDDNFTYTWDAENRLTEIAPEGNPSEGDKKAVFDYDYMSRRIRKRLYTHDGNNWQLSEDLRFVYDQWNPVLVLDGNNEVHRKYTWGLDLSLTMHSAGGVGGLLSVVETQDTATTADDENYWFVYDGNGNVGQVLDATDTSDVSLAAHYEYDPYGDTLVVDDVDSSGYANENPYRFSTKWLDDDLTTGDNNGGAIESSGLYYYGFRYYSPNLGRWIKRDPIGEKGFRLVSFGIAMKNLYCFVANDPVLGLDYLGLDVIYGPDDDVDKTDTCCTETKDYWDANGFASPDDCESDCFAKFAGWIAGGGGVLAGICAASNNPVVAYVCSIIGTASGSYALGLAGIGCPIACEMNQCVSTEHPTLYWTVEGWFPWTKKCVKKWKCPECKHTTR